MKAKRCKVCHKPFMPERPLQQACGYKCAMELAQERVERLHKQRKRKEAREQRAKLKTRSQWLSEAQVWVNKFIRLRDDTLPCISCGRYHSGQYHASHYRSVGACSSLRFHEDNIHKACKPCNADKSGNIVEYRIRLIEKIGLDRVEWIESQPKMHQWTVQDAKDIIEMYKEKVKSYGKMD